MLNTSAEAEKLALRPIEAARALGIGQRKLWQLTNDGEIPHVRIGHSLRYVPADLQSWLESRKVIVDKSSTQR